MPGTELTWDYGCCPGGLEWLKRRPARAKERALQFTREVGAGQDKEKEEVDE
ncbi:hypothetical protein GBAR_LOCUS17214, partial [Geodia barretti]